MFLVAALLSHQMDQYLKLRKEIDEGNREVAGIKSDISNMQQELKQQQIMMESHSPKLVVSCLCLLYSIIIILPRSQFANCTRFL